MGEELYLTFARAAVEHSDRALRPISPDLVPTVIGPESREVREIAADWTDEQRERIAAAEVIAAKLSGAQLDQQRHRIAGLKRALTLGPEDLRAAAAKAARNRET